MKLKDNSSGVEITLPDSLLWSDELSWDPTVMAVSYSLTGSVLVDVGTKQAGRPITLEPPEASMGWVPRSTALALQEWLTPANRKLTFSIGTGEAVREFTVMFRHSDGALEGAPVKGFPEYNADAWYSITLRLIEVPND